MLSNIDMVYLLRGFLRLLLLTAPVTVVVSALAWDDRRLSWVDPGQSFGGDVVDRLGTDLFGTARPGTELQYGGQVQFVVAHASTPLWLLHVVPSLVVAVAVSTVAFVLLQLLAETVAGRPFTEQMPSRLRAVALVVAAAAVAAPALTAAADTAIARRVSPEHAPGWFATWDVWLTLGWLVAAGLVALLTEVFRVGVRLSDDVEGLV
jgi:hypothetical protein